MIKVTRLNGKVYYMNAVYIESVESNPDTMLTLTNGKKLVVREREEEVVSSILSFYQTINLLGRKE
ncbi:MAG: flagellar FlbD family protein [Bacillus sp. (in: firmicutes)]